MSEPRVLCVMGSGETSPTMVKTHRGLLDRLGVPPVPAVMLDTPFGFQENAGELTAKAVEYFRESVGRDLDVASYRDAHTSTPVELETMLARLAAARFVFAGPGSPSYALRQWHGTPVHDLLADKLRRGGVVVFASAAALTLGRFTIPVYEIYKVGDEVRWLDGLDLVAEAGLDVAVVPHWNNAEGGTHDTRYCYMGERRLRMLEAQLPASTSILGVDEHTACVLDLDGRTATISGVGGVHVRHAGVATTFASGAVVSFDELLSGSGAEAASPLPASSTPAAPTRTGATSDTSTARSPLLDEVDRLDAAFAAALDGRDASAAANAVLELEDTLAAWATETFSGDEMARARRVLRSTIVRLGEAAAGGVRDPRDVVGPYVDALLAARADLRAAKEYGAADALRDRLIAVGVEVRDTPDGATWELE